MMIDGLVSYLLSQDLPIADMVGGRLQPIPAPDNIDDYPCIVYQSASYTEEYTGDGAAGIAKERIVFDCLATPSGKSGGYKRSREIGFAVRKALSGLHDIYLPDNTQVLFIEIVNIVGGWNDAARTIYKTSVHAQVQYAIQ